MYIACMKIERSNFKIYIFYILVSFMVVFVVHSSFPFPVSQCLHSVMGNNEFSVYCLLFFPCLSKISFFLFLYLFGLCWHVEKEITGILLRKEIQQQQNMYKRVLTFVFQQLFLLLCYFGMLRVNKKAKLICYRIEVRIECVVDVCTSTCHWFNHIHVLKHYPFN